MNSGTRFIYLCASIVSLVAMAQAGLYPEAELFVEPAYMTSNQVHPDMAFDMNGTVHVVWSGDYTSGINQIFHRSKTPSGGASATELIAIDTDCLTVDCGFDYPAITISSGNYGMVVYPGSVAHPTIDSVELYVPTGTWANKGDADSGIGGPFEEVAITNSFNFAFLAHSYLNGIRFSRFNTGVWDPASEYLLIPGGPNQQFSNFDLAADEDGYLYLVYDVNDLSTGYKSAEVRRTVNPNDFTAGFEPARPLEAEHSINFESEPAIFVQGAAGSSDLAVSIAWVHLNVSNPQVFGLVEFNGDWGNSGPMSGLSNQACNWTMGYAVGLDVVRTEAGVLHLVWMDTRTGLMETYAASSYNDADSFLTDECISCGVGGSGSVNSPVIAISQGIGKDLAIAYSKQESLGNHVYLAFTPTLFFDACDTDFSNWDSHSGVTIDPTFAHDPGGGSFRFATAGKRGLLVNDFSPARLTGTLDFWFHDTGSNDADFWCRIDGDDGLRSGVYRMVGINNASSHSAYSINTGLDAWEPTSVMRNVGWHHVIVTVNGGMIDIRIDPEMHTTPVHTSGGFEYFDRIEFEGGTEADPYHLDDVHIISELIRSTPAMSVIGTIVLLLSIGILLMIRHR